ncbi:NADP-dependent oxidoreductase [Solihabitans fulvus]|uniref:NADP-dependent oxidoreductase n=1 Tax=Solihabitans fulvus TaxID=1892852 RepID=A0A5B2XTS6_9PSEU|nr:NADP-dependent oxidoreductase [Solihabitans fulvus]KAA2267077.1 NADP-dependent oxidoreductase [Solihabitans fulvus]
MSSKARYVHQVGRPTGFPTPDNFAFVEDGIPAVTPGTALVENIYLSVDPYMRQLMDDDEDSWDLHTPLDGRSIGRVVASEDPGLAVGDLVFHRQAWRTHALVSAATAQVLPALPGVSLSAHLSILGGTGLTAYVALTRIARLQPGETVFISAAAGGVGTAAGQLARALGAGRIIGSAGSAAKVRHLTEDLGFDAAFDYHDGSVTDQLREAAPDGIQVYVDNVGGDHLEAAIDSLVDHGRVAWVGAIAQYNTAEPPAAPRNLFEVQLKGARVEGVRVSEWQHLKPELLDFAAPRIESGLIVPDETIVNGFDEVVNAFLGMLRGENVGKMIVRTSPE